MAQAEDFINEFFFVVLHKCVPVVHGETVGRNGAEYK